MRGRAWLAGLAAVAGNGVAADRSGSGVGTGVASWPRGPGLAAGAACGVAAERGVGVAGRGVGVGRGRRRGRCRAPHRCTRRFRRWGRSRGRRGGCRIGPPGGLGLLFAAHRLGSLMGDVADGLPSLGTGIRRDQLRQLGQQAGDLVCPGQGGIELGLAAGDVRRRSPGPAGGGAWPRPSACDRACAPAGRGASRPARRPSSRPPATAVGRVLPRWPARTWPART